MAVYLVSCEIAGAGAGAPRLSERLAGYGEFRQLGAAMWLLTTREDALEMRDGLADCLSPSDKLLIARLHGDAVLEGYPMPVDEWVTDTLLCESC